MATNDLNQKPKKKGGCMKWGGIGIVAIVVIAIASSLTGGDDDASTTASSSIATSSVAEADVSDSTGGPEIEAEEAEEPEVPREYKNALRSAEQYLNFSSFSYAGLYDQLTSEYADSYPAEAAQYAVDNVEVDWNEEAVEAARTYQEFSSFSDSGLYDQLTSEYADKFTPEQAQYAIDNY